MQLVVFCFIYQPGFQLFIAFHISKTMLKNFSLKLKVDLMDIYSLSHINFLEDQNRQTSVDMLETKHVKMKWRSSNILILVSTTFVLCHVLDLYNPCSSQIISRFLFNLKLLDRLIGEQQKVFSSVLPGSTIMLTSSSPEWVDRPPLMEEACSPSPPAPPTQLPPALPPPPPLSSGCEDHWSWNKNDKSHEVRTIFQQL